MDRLQALRIRDEILESEWLKLIDATVSVLDSLASSDAPDDSKEAAAFVDLYEATQEVGMRRLQLWEQIATLERAQ